MLNYRLLSIIERGQNLFTVFFLNVIFESRDHLPLHEVTSLIKICLKLNDNCACFSPTESDCSMIEDLLLCPRIVSESAKLK